MSKQRRGRKKSRNSGDGTCTKVATQFYNIAQKHGFKVANKTANRVKDLIGNAKTPLGGKRTKVVYQIPCNCRKHAYTRKTDCKWERRQKEHQEKERLTREDIGKGNTESEEKSLNDGDGGVAKHVAKFPQDIDLII